MTFMLFIWRIGIILRFVCECCWRVFCRGCIGWAGVRKTRSGCLCGLVFGENNGFFGIYGHIMAFS